MYKKRFPSKRFNAGAPKIAPKINIPPQKKDNTPFIIGGVIAVVLVLIIIVASSGGGEDNKTANKPKARDFTALIKEAKDYENKGITLYNSVESTVWPSRYRDYQDDDPRRLHCGQNPQPLRS